MSYNLRNRVIESISVDNEKKKVDMFIKKRGRPKKKKSIEKNISLIDSVTGECLCQTDRVYVDGNDQVAQGPDVKLNIGEDEEKEEEIVMKNNESSHYNLFDMSAMTDAILESTTIDFYQYINRLTIRKK